MWGSLSATLRLMFLWIGSFAGLPSGEKPAGGVWDEGCCSPDVERERSTFRHWRRHQGAGCWHWGLERGSSSRPGSVRLSDRADLDTPGFPVPRPGPETTPWRVGWLKSKPLGLRRSLAFPHPPPLSRIMSGGPLTQIFAFSAGYLALMVLLSALVVPLTNAIPLSHVSFEPLHSFGSLVLGALS